MVTVGNGRDPPARYVVDRESNIATPWRHLEGDPRLRIERVGYVGVKGEIRSRGWSYIAYRIEPTVHAHVVKERRMTVARVESIPAVINGKQPNLHMCDVGTDRGQSLLSMPTFVGSRFPGVVPYPRTVKTVARIESNI